MVHDSAEPDVPTVRSGEPRVTADATADLVAAARWCTCCKRPLKGKFAWLELDQRTNTYHDHGGVPMDHSQGWFPFGMTCARTEIAKARIAVDA